MFTDTLAMTLDLTIKGKTVSVPGGDIKACRLDLESHGLAGEVTFWVQSQGATQDGIWPVLSQPDLVEVRLALNMAESSAKPLPQVVAKGLVTEKVVHETTFHGARDEPVMQREYTLRFADAASVLWRQHFPLTLLVDKSLTDLMKMHLPEGVGLDIDCDDFANARSLICLPLGEEDVSFYDFLLWRADAAAAVFHLDYDKFKYHLSDKKPKLGKAATLDGHDISDVRVHFPEIARHSTKLMNCHTEALAAEVPVPQDQAVSGVHRAVLLRTALPVAVATRAATEKTRLRQPRPEVEIALARLPTVAVGPGSAVALQKEYFSADVYQVGAPLRVRALRLEADTGLAHPAGHKATEASYQVELVLRCEHPSDPVARRPRFAQPRYPIMVEGTIVSEGGSEGDRSYTPYDDTSTSTTSYKVKVPLWNQVVRVPYQPHGTAGHLYFPAFKGSRVLLALYFDRAHILEFLDWGTDVRLPNDSQGNHLLLGKNKTSQTSFKHVYKDNKPTLSMTRINNGDLQLIELSEGSLVIESKEDPSQKGSEAKFDCTAQVAAARENMAAGSRASVGKITGAFQKTKVTLEGKTEDAKNKVDTAAEGMVQEIKSQAAQAKAAIEGAMAELEGKAVVMKTKANAAIGELKKKLTEL